MIHKKLQVDYEPDPELARFWLSILDVYSVGGQFGSLYGPYWTE